MTIAAEPIVLVEIDWTSGTGKYGQKLVEDYDDRIMEVGGLSTVASDNTQASISSLSIRLNDTDSVIKTLYNTTGMDRRAVRVYIYYQSPVTKTLIMQGYLTTQFEWSEGGRSVGITIDTFIRSDEVPWPMVFGNVLNVPGRIDHTPFTGSLKNATPVTATDFEVENGSEFPQATPLTLAVEADYIWVNFNVENVTRSILHPILFEGQFDGDEFIVSAGNVALYSDLVIAARVADADFLNPEVLWISDSTVSLVGLFCHVYNPVTMKHAVNYCIKQEGTKCWFSQAWRNYTPDFDLANYGSPRLLPDAVGLEIDEAISNVPGRWGVTYVQVGLLRFTDANTGVTTVTNINSLSTIVPDFLVMPAGLRVRDHLDRESVYIVNQAPSVAILRIMAMRQRTQDSEPVLEVVPTSYYTVSLVGPTTVTFDLALSLRTREGWSDDIYAVVRSTLSNNTADAIQWLIDNYTTATADATTFAAVALDIQNYHSNFATLSDLDGLDLCKEMAWQARCALDFSRDDVEIRYLSKAVTAEGTYNHSNVEYQSLVGSYTDLNKLKTKFLAKWHSDYAKDEKEYLFENNIDLYGLEEEDRDFFIYTDERMVRYSIGFWGIRYSNIWRKVRFSGFLTDLTIRPFKTYALSVPEYAASAIRGTLEEFSFNTTDYGTALSLELAARAGGMTEYLPYWSGDPSNEITVSNPAPPDPTDGIVPLDYVVDLWPVETTTDKQNNTARTFSTRTFTATTLVRRGTNFNVQVVMQDQDGKAPSGNLSVSLELIGGAVGDALSVTNITLVNGYWSGNVNINGGGTEPAVFAIRVNPATTNLSVIPTDPITVDLVGAAIFSGIPTTVVRGEAFDVTITRGFPNTSYNLSLIGTGPGTLDPTSIMLDSSGEASFQLTINDTVDQAEYYQIQISRLSYTELSDTLTVLAIEAASGGGRNQAFVCKVGTKVSGNTYNVTIYPIYPLETTVWTTTALQLQGNTAKTIPVDSFTIAAGVLSDGGDSEDPDDYTFFIQVPIWL